MQSINNVAIEKPAPVMNEETILTFILTGDYVTEKCSLYVEGKEVESFTSNYDEKDNAGICLAVFVEKNFQKELLALNLTDYPFTRKDGDKISIVGYYGFYDMTNLLFRMGYYLYKLSSTMQKGEEHILFALKKI